MSRSTLGQTFVAMAMARIFMMLAMACAQVAMAAQPPFAYADLQSKAGERLQILVNKVEMQEKQPGAHEYQVEVDATIKHVFQSSSGLKNGDSIHISYVTFIAESDYKGNLPAPLLRQGKRYPAYLNQNLAATQSPSVYVPAASDYSFAEAEQPGKLLNAKQESAPEQITFTVQSVSVTPSTPKPWEPGFALPLWVPLLVTLIVVASAGKFKYRKAVVVLLAIATLSDIGARLFVYNQVNELVVHNKAKVPVVPDDEDSDVELDAVVKNVAKSASGLRVGNNIKINYTIERKRGGSSPRRFPEFKAGTDYPGYLVKDESDLKVQAFIPAAGEASFSPPVKPES
ncbi:MAG: hypothetical protein ACAI35_08950 [Candidatus Methylacidiphilales bacterium]|nr:hypothetical protein [Candidatus Methylacidiphilales bacterium]